ncbi:MAG: serine/threonine protein phosphatase [Candidatus Bathyarchaeota archaeon]|nr:serine/threonine protein phosphatase [Candidatus Bathyarchaeota archaeon]
MAFSAKDSSNLIDMATKTSSNEFLRLTQICTQLLAKKSRRVGNLRITGRLVEVPPVGEAIIVGDIHGDLESLTHILEDSSFMEKANGGEDILLIFLGDYGDRGFYSPEVYYVVLKLKELFPERVVLMRGNHEGPDDLLASPHDLPFHLNRKFGERGSEVYLKLRELFNHLYNAVLIEERYILLHGGAPSQASAADDIAYAHEKHPSERHLEEILWSDPWEGIKGTYASPRGAGRLFGENVTERLLKMLGVKALIRGHEPSEEGFKTNHNGKVLTIFSRRGQPYHNDYGAYLYLNISRKVEKTKQLLQSIRKF